jgi:23S rRNA pseudouridine2605 synthase
MTEPTEGVEPAPIPQDPVESRPVATQQAHQPGRAKSDDDYEEGDEDDEDEDGDEGPGAARRKAQAAPAAAQVPGILFADVVSGQFDADEESPEVALAKRVLAPQAETPKLHKVLAQAGMGSRLEMEQLILEGASRSTTSRPISASASSLATRSRSTANPSAFALRRRLRASLPTTSPRAEVVTHDDPQNRPTVFRRLPKLQQGKWQSVGRLDLNTEGLLLFTSSGELANKLMHPRFGLEREYAVRVLGALNNDEKSACSSGVKLDDGMAQFGSIETAAARGPTPGTA